MYALLFIVLLLPAAAAQTNTFTLMLYVDGSTLEEQGGFFSQDLYELKAALPKDGRFNIVICTGGAGKWASSEILGGCVQYHAITKDGLTSSDIVSSQSILESATLSSFLRYTLANYPAERYGLVFWGHGNASPVGFGRSGEASMGLAAVDKGLRDGLQSQRLAFIGFDACLLGSVDMALMASGYADYMIASEELLPSLGWSYAPLAQALSNDPGLPGKDIAQLVANSCVNDIQSKMSPYKPALTLSVVDLKRMAAVKDALRAFSRKLAKQINTLEGFAAVSKARAATKYFGGVGDSRDMVDLYDFASQFSGLKEATRLKQALQKAVIYNKTFDSAASHGLSAYFPMQNEHVFGKAADYYTYAPEPDFLALALAFYEQYRGGSAMIEMSVDDERLTIAAASLPYVRSADAVLVRRLPDGKAAAIGFVPLDLKNGAANLVKPQGWLHVGGVPVCYDSEKSGGARIAAPIMLNNKYARFELMRAGAVAFDGVVYKAGPEMFGLKAGDKIAFLYPILDDAPEQAYLKSAVVTFNGAFVVEERALEDDVFVAVRVTDVFGKRHYGGIG